MRRLIAVLSVLALYACDSGGGPAGVIGTGGETGGNSTGAAGTYTLKTVNGASLPYEFPVPGLDKYEVLDDRVILTADGAWTQIGHDRQTLSGAVTILTIVDGGTYTISGTVLYFRSTTAGSPVTNYQGSLSGNVMVLPYISSAGQHLAMSYSK